MIKKSNNIESRIILHLEDSTEDAELVADILGRGELHFDIHLVSEIRSFTEEIKQIKPDVILSDFNLRGFDGFEALTIAKEYASDTPFIFITGALGEEMAVTTLKSGATDFILKSNLSRLLPAVNRAIDEKRIADDRKKLYHSLKVSEERYRSLTENLPVGIFRTSLSQPGRFIHANLMMARMYGFDSIEQLLDMPIEKFYANPDKRKDFRLDIIENKNVKNRILRLKKISGESFWGSISAACYFDSTGVPVWIDGVIEDVTERVENEQELKKINEELDILINSIQSVIIGVSVKDRITNWNPYAEIVFGIKSIDIIGKRFYEAEITWNWETIYEAISDSILDEKSVHIDDLIFKNQEGKNGILGLTINPLKRGGKILNGFIILGKDVTEQRILETQLLQSNKLEAIGQLAAGVAHEINTPMQYVGDNLKFINKSFIGVLNMLDIYERASKNVENTCELTDIIQQAEDLSKKIKLPYLLEQMPKALEQSLEGVARISGIVQSMKAFSHPGTGVKMPADINKAIENTVTVSRNEWKYDCELKLELDLNLPNVPCFESELNQVILNLIVNARDAIVEAKVKNSIDTGLIKISTTLTKLNAVIKVEDNGTGIPEKIRDKIFDPFFTTKDVGKGTGQGLPISHSIIVEKHGGMLYFESENGKGTTFIIKLPLE